MNPDKCAGDVIRSKRCIKTVSRAYEISVVHEAELSEISGTAEMDCIIQLILTFKTSTEVDDRSHTNSGSYDNARKGGRSGNRHDHRSEGRTGFS